MKRALLTGITGQDASYLAELLLAKGYKVYGLKRRTSVVSTARIKHLLSDIELLDGDLCDTPSLMEAVKVSQPDEIYHLGAQSFVQTSFAQPEATGDITGLGTTRLLEAVSKFAPQGRFYNACSSEIFGSTPPPQNELTKFHPRSPYGAAKMYSYWMTVNYREREKNPLFACSGILFNHESPRRGAEFVTQKIAQGAAAIALGQADVLKLGNLDAKRDWGHSQDFVEAMWLMLQASVPDDYVISTGIAHSVREFAEAAFKRVGLDYQEYVEIDPLFYRPSEVDFLLGDCSKAKRELGWSPKIDFAELVNGMVDWALAHPEEWTQNRTIVGAQ